MQKFLHKNFQKSKKLFFSSEFIFLVLFHLCVLKHPSVLFSGIPKPQQYPTQARSRQVIQFCDRIPHKSDTDRSPRFLTVKIFYTTLVPTGPWGLQEPRKFSTQARSPRYHEKLLHKPYPADPQVLQSFSAQARYWTSPGTTKLSRKNQVPQVPHVPWKFSAQPRPGMPDKTAPPLARGVKPWFLVKNQWN